MPEFLFTAYEFINDLSNTDFFQIYLAPDDAAKYVARRADAAELPLHMSIILCLIASGHGLAFSLTLRQ